MFIVNKATDHNIKQFMGDQSDWKIQQTTHVWRFEQQNVGLL